MELTIGAAKKEEIKRKSRSLSLHLNPDPDMSIASSPSGLFGSGSHKMPFLLKLFKRWVFGHLQKMLGYLMLI